MASGGRDEGLSDEIFDYICTSCAEDNVTKEGIRYCVECKGYCCKVCVSNHKKYPVLREHSLVDISTSQHGDQTPYLPSLPTEKCSIHQRKVIDMYCGDHDVVGCSTCISIGHRNCTDIHSILDDVDQITNDGELQKTFKDLQTVTESLKSTLQNSNNIYLQNLERAKQNSFLAISEHRREKDAILDRLEDDAKGKVLLPYNKLKANLLNANERIESSLDKFVELGEKIRRAEGNKSEKFVCSKLVSSTITKEQDNIKTSKEELETFTADNLFSFLTNTSIIEFLQKIENLGQVIDKTQKKNTPYRIKQCRDIVARIPSDTTTCKLRGCCLLGDNKLIIADCANKKLKRVDIAQVSVIDHIDIPYDIRGVCCVNGNEVAVACNINKMIQFVYIGQTMTLSRQMKLNHLCYHVAYMDNKLYVSDNGSSVYIYDIVGTLLQTISESNSGNKLFRYATQIALCESENHMFVGGFDGLVCFDKKGNHIATIKDPDMNGTLGVCNDGRGNVFAAGKYSDKVVQLRYDGTKIGVIVKKEDGIQTPMVLLFHRNFCKLFVNMEECDKMKMFDLE